MAKEKKEKLTLRRPLLKGGTSRRITLSIPQELYERMCKHSSDNPGIVWSHIAADAFERLLKLEGA